MPIDGVRPNTAAAGKSGIVAGQTAMPAEVVEARVAAILDNGVVRFNTAYGPLDLSVEQNVAIGDRARIMIENTGAKLTLTLIGLTATADGAVAALRPGLPGATPVAQTLLSSPALPSGPAAARPPDEPARAAQAMARAAAATQAPATSLMARLSAVMANASGGLPAEVRAAVQEVLSQALRLDTPPDAEALREAVRRSGLFHEALAARTGQAPADFKQALVTLKAALAAWSPPETAAPAGAAPAMTADGEGTSPLIIATARTAPPAVSPVPVGGQAVATAATPAALQPVPPQIARQGVEPDADAPVRTTGPGAPPAGPASALPAGLASLPQEAMALPPALLRQLVARAFGSPEAEPRVESSSQERGSAPPRADVPPRATAPERAPQGFAELPPQELREALLGATDGALDRLKLAQYASLPREGTAAAPAAPPPQQQAGPPAVPPAWVMELPMLAGREATLAQMRVTRDGRGSGTAEQDGPSWSIDVALDMSETGPIHARVRLGGGRLGVTLWAERGDVAERLRQDMPALRRTLDDAAFAVDDVAILTGAPAAPPRGAAAAGYLLDTRS